MDKLVEQMEEKLAEIKADLKKLAEKGNKSAATRARVTASSLAKDCKALRISVAEAKSLLK